MITVSLTGYFGWETSRVNRRLETTIDALRGANLEIDEQRRDADANFRFAQQVIRELYLVGSKQLDGPGLQPWQRDVLADVQGYYLDFESRNNENEALVH